MKSFPILSNICSLDFYLPKGGGGYKGIGKWLTKNVTKSSTPPPPNLETRYKNNFVWPNELLSQVRLSKGIPFKTCDNRQARDQNINRANVHENEMI